MTVKDIVTEMVVWENKAYLYASVWEDLQSKVNPAALEVKEASLRYEVPKVQTSDKVK